MPSYLVELIVIIYTVINICSFPYISKLYIKDDFVKDLTVGQILIIGFNAGAFLVLFFKTVAIAIIYTCKDIIYKGYNKVSHMLGYKPFSRKR